MEPEVTALLHDLVKLGAQIEGIGTPFLTITGSQVSGGTMDVIPDRIEMGTMAVLAALSAEQINITSCRPEHAAILWQLFEDMGIRFELRETGVTIYGAESITAPTSGEIITHEYPGLPTDLQSPLMVLLTQAKGKTLVHETIHENRLQYTDRLNMMGADIRLIDAHRAIVNGPTPLRGARLGSSDVRAGAAVVIAGLIAKGETTVVDTYPIERGYPHFVERLQTIGAQISKVEL